MNKFWIRRVEKTIPDDVAGWKWYKLTKGTRFSIQPNIKRPDNRYADLGLYQDDPYMVNYKPTNPLLIIPVDFLLHIEKSAAASHWGLQLSDIFVDE